jgi:hypothetical protein
MNLTNEMRNNAIAAAVRDTFKARDAKYDRMRVTFADALFDYAFGEPEAKARKHVPAHWFHVHNELYISADGFLGRFHHPRPGTPSAIFKLSRDRYFPANIGDKLTVAKGHALYAQLCAVERECREIEAAKQRLRDKLRALLWSVTTFAKLEQAWPRGVKYLPKPVAKTGTAVVPADLAAQVDALMGVTA